MTCNYIYRQRRQRSSFALAEGAFVVRCSFVRCPLSSLSLSLSLSPLIDFSTSFGVTQQRAMTTTNDSRRQLTVYDDIALSSLR